MTADIEDFPPGTRVRTPTGRIGVVEKVRGRQSKRDHFERLVIRLGPKPRDTIALQPHLLTKCPPPPVPDNTIDP